MFQAMNVLRSTLELDTLEEQELSNQDAEEVLRKRLKQLQSQLASEDSSSKTKEERLELTNQINQVRIDLKQLEDENIEIERLLTEEYKNKESYVDVLEGLLPVKQNNVLQLKVDEEVNRLRSSLISYVNIIVQELYSHKVKLTFAAKNKEDIKKTLFERLGVTTFNSNSNPDKRTQMNTEIISSERVAEFMSIMDTFYSGSNSEQSSKRDAEIAKFLVNLNIIGFAHHYTLRHDN